MDDTTIWAIKVFASVVGIVLLFIGVPGMFDDMQTWRMWVNSVLNFLERHRKRWLLTVVGPLIIIAAWLPWQNWVGATSSESSPATQFPIEAYLLSEHTQAMKLIAEHARQQMAAGDDRESIRRELSEGISREVNAVLPASLEVHLGKEARAQYLEFIKRATEQSPDDVEVLFMAASEYLRGLVFKSSDIAADNLRAVILKYVDTQPSD